MYKFYHDNIQIGELPEDKSLIDSMVLASNHISIHGHPNYRHPWTVKVTKDDCDFFFLLRIYTSSDHPDPKYSANVMKIEQDMRGRGSGKINLSA